MGAKDKLQGEGDRESARRYDEAAKAFVESGKVKEQRETTAKISPEEERELEEGSRSPSEARINGLGEGRSLYIDNVVGGLGKWWGRRPLG
jgi:hypothetical protein